MKLTILGSCRQDSLRKNYNCSAIQSYISYPHYTKEALEVIKFCIFGNVTPEETIHIFRTPILTKMPLYPSMFWKNELESSDVFIIEIASKIAYEYNGHYMHHIATEEQYGIPIRDNILQRVQTKDEIETDILEIRDLLRNKPIIIVSHLVTYKRGERYMLAEWLEDICVRHKICFLNPVKEFQKRNIPIDDLFEKESILAHYSHKGHAIINTIYTEYIANLEGHGHEFKM